MKVIETARSENRQLLTEAESKQVLEAYDIGIVPTVLASTAEEAEHAARTLASERFAVKLNSTTLTHKADVGGVKLNVRPEDVRGAFEAIMESVTSLHGASHFEGVTVQPMLRLEKGLELILGSTVDPQFGPLVMFGSGGTMVEVFKDTALATPPLNDNLAEKLMKQTKIYKALKGGHGKRFEGVDLPKLLGTLTRFSAMITELSNDVQECDINPLLATKDSLVALDARFALRKPEEEAPRLVVRPYPAEYACSKTLEDGSQMKIRPVIAADEKRVLAFFEALPAKIVEQRYVDGHSSVAINKGLMIKMCHADFDRQVTLLASAAEDKIAGVVEIERPPPNHLNRECGQVRMMVAPEYENRGLAEALMDVAVQVAQAEGISKLRAPVSTKDRSLLDLLRQSRWTCSDKQDANGVVTCDLKM